MRLTSLTMLLVAGVLVLAPLAGEAQDKAKDPKARKVDLDKIAQAGPGVYNLEFDAKGRLISCVIVGTSRISTVLGAAKGKEVARQRASLACDAEFVKFLKSEVSVHEKSEDETIIFLAGNEGNDKDALAEAGKATERTVNNMERVARGLTRGMQVAHFEINADDKTYTLVKKWKSKTSDAVKKVEASLKEDAKTGGSSGTKSKPENKKLENKKVTIDD